MEGVKRQRGNIKPRDNRPASAPLPLSSSSGPRGKRSVTVVSFLIQPCATGICSSPHPQHRLWKIVTFGGGGGRGDTVAALPRGPSWVRCSGRGWVLGEGEVIEGLRNWRIEGLRL